MSPSHTPRTVRAARFGSRGCAHPGPTPLASGGLFGSSPPRRPHRSVNNSATLGSPCSSALPPPSPHQGSSILPRSDYLANRCLLLTGHQGRRRNTSGGARPADRRPLSKRILQGIWRGRSQGKAHIPTHSPGSPLKSSPLFLVKMWPSQGTKFLRANAGEQRGDWLQRGTLPPRAGSCVHASHKVNLKPPNAGASVPRTAPAKLLRSGTVCVCVC